MSRSVFLIAVIVCLFSNLRTSLAQSSGTFGSRTLGGGVAGSSQTNRNQGLAQTGQISSSAAIQRQTGAFVGADAGDSNNLRSLSGGRGAQGGFGSGLSSGLGFGLGQGAFGNTGRQGQGFGQNNQGGGAGGTTRTIRAPIRLGFTPLAAGATYISGRMQARFTKIPLLAVRSGMIVVKMEGRTAVLQGAVASEHQRRLAARLALFEPGVSDVRNELKVDPAVAPPEKSSPPEPR